MSLPWTALLLLALVSPVAVHAWWEHRQSTRSTQPEETP